MTSHRIIISMR